ncbi:DUF456 family protein [Patescibacteria group bacterium]|nr:DUF456 family protein [Patescibacteria group bacterium]
MLEIAILIISLLVMFAGLLGIVIPNLPGIVLIWTGVFFYASTTKFAILDQEYILFITSLALFAILLDYAESILGSRKTNNGFRGIIGAVLGGIIGGTSGSMIMMVAGTVAGATFGVIVSGRDPIFSVETKDYKIIMHIGSTIIKIAVGVAIIESFVVKVFA